MALMTLTISLNKQHHHPTTNIISLSATAKLQTYPQVFSLFQDVLLTSSQLLQIFTSIAQGVDLNSNKNKNSTHLCIKSIIH